MALVTCPECGREHVSDTALSCPDCGFNIREYFEKQHTNEEQYKAVLRPLEPSSILETVKFAIFKQTEDATAKAGSSMLPKKAEGKLFLYGVGSGLPIDYVMKRTRCSVVAIDPNPKNYSKARNNDMTFINGGRLEMSASSLADFDCTEPEFDYALVVNQCCWEMNWLLGIRQLAKAVKEGGTVVYAFCHPRYVEKYLKDPMSGEEEILHALQDEGFTVEENRPNGNGVVIVLKK